MRDVEAFVRNQIRRILREDSSAPAPTPTPSATPSPTTPTGGSPSAKPAAGGDGEGDKGPRVVRGRVGGGRFSDAVNVAGSLADKNPAELVKKLGLKGATGSTAAEKVNSIVQQAITGASVMRDAYHRSEIMRDEAGVTFIRVAHSSELKPRDAAQYMFLVFQAASKEGMLGGIPGRVVPGLMKTDQGDIVAIVLKK